MKRKLRRFMNPDSNLTRDSVPQVMSVNSNRDIQMEESGSVVARHNENAIITKLMNQLEFYLGDSNLAKDHYLRRKLDASNQLDLALFLDFNRIKGIFGNLGDKSE
jgi:hypothetical protein